MLLLELLHSLLFEFSLVLIREFGLRYHYVAVDGSSSVFYVVLIIEMPLEDGNTTIPRSAAV